MFWWEIRRYDRRRTLVIRITGITLASDSAITGEHPNDHNHQDFPKSTAIQVGGVLQYKWEAYCDTNGRSTDSISLFFQSVGTPKGLQYKLEAYCKTNWRCIAILFLRSSGGWGF